MMKRIILIASILILLGGGLSYAAFASSDTAKTKADIYIKTDEENVESDSESIDDFPEYDVLTDVVDMDLYNAEIVKNNDYKRVILLTDDNNHEQFKSIYSKDKNRLKIIDLHGGLLYNEKI